MSTFLITYDLHRPGRNYPELYDAIKKLGTWAHPVESVWLIVYEGSSSDIRDALLKHVDKNDTLLVYQVAKTYWAAYNIQNKDVIDWMNKNG